MVPAHKEATGWGGELSQCSPGVSPARERAQGAQDAGLASPRTRGVSVPHRLAPGSLGCRLEGCAPVPCRARACARSRRGGAWRQVPPAAPTEDAGASGCRPVPWLIPGRPRGGGLSEHDPRLAKYLEIHRGKKSQVLDANLTESVLTSISLQTLLIPSHHAAQVGGLAPKAFASIKVFQERSG